MRPPEDRVAVLDLFAQGISMREIERRTGVPYPTVYRWCNPEWAEEDRASARAWKDRNRDRNRARDNERARRLDKRGKCLDCGGPMGIGKRHDGTCASCLAAQKEAKWAEVEAMWAAGLTLLQIAAHMGWTKGHICAEIDRMRKAGRAVPHRYRTYAGRPVAATASAQMDRPSADTRKGPRDE